MSMVEVKDAGTPAPAQPLSFAKELGNKVSQFSAALPKHIPQERFARVVMTAVQRNLELLHADRQSLWNSSMQAAADGLLPDGREGALVVYKTKDGSGGWIKKVQWLPMIAGIRKKVRNSGEIIDWTAQVVHANDAFEYELGDDPFIKHKPLLGGDRGPVIAAYSVVTLKGGEKSREVMTIAELNKVKGASKSPDAGPWKTWFEEMCRKTVAKRHAKVLPMSTDLDDLIRRDDELYDLKGASDRVSGSQRLSLAGKLDALANQPTAEQEVLPGPAHDPDTGEITEQPAAEVTTDLPLDKGQPENVQTQEAATAAADPVHVALLAKLQAKAAKGTKALRMALGGLSQDDEAILSDADHEALGEAADAADERSGRV